MILIFYAFSREVGPLKRRLRGRRAIGEPGLRGFECAASGGQRAVFVATGIGMERARETARLALDRFSEAELVIGTGVAGALAPGMAPGHIVVADRIVMATAEGASAEPHVIVSEQARTHCEDRLRSAGLPFSRGALLSSHRVLASVEAKRLAHEQSGAIAVDMESAAIAAETERRRMPFVVVRTVMDAVEDEVFGADLADEHGRVSALAATGYLARNPSAIAQLPRMMRSLGRATRSIADAIEALGFTTQL